MAFSFSSWLSIIVIFQERSYESVLLHEKLGSVHKNVLNFSYFAFSKDCQCDTAVQSLIKNEHTPDSAKKSTLRLQLH